MFEVTMPREIKAYKEKIVAGMTVRQLICNSLALLIDVPLFYFGRAYVNEDVLMWIIFGVAGGLGYIGYGSKNGMTAERYLITVIEFTFIKPQKRYFACKTKRQALFEIEYEEKQAELKKISEGK